MAKLNEVSGIKEMYHNVQDDWSNMRIFRTEADMRAYRAELPERTRIGFVPTMGGLHDGHLELIRMCKCESDITIVSIFVNPAQFAPGEDLFKYPRTEPQDLNQCKVMGVDVVFIPSVEHVYPNGYGTWLKVDVGEPSRNPNSEGASRPTFFSGVATVVIKLLHVVTPTVLYAGQKDAQQCAVLRAIINDLWFDIKLVIVPTRRESDGLAMSSRNGYLKPFEREHATIVFRCLNMVVNSVYSGENNANNLRRKMRYFFEVEWDRPSGIDFVLLYVSICEQYTMLEVQENLPTGVPVMACIAARLGSARLIDNVVLPKTTG